MSKFFIGIDPGANGAIALVSSKGILEHFVYSKNFKHIAVILKSWRIMYEADNLLANLEKVWAFKGQGVTSAFNFGGNFYAWQYALTREKIKYECIASKTWQTIIDIDIKDSKKRSVAFANKLYNLTLTDKQHDLADAINLAYYNYRRNT